MSGRHTGENAERLASLIVLLRRAPTRAVELQGRLHVDKGTLYRYLRALSDKGLVVRGKGAYYSWR
jgi:DNA-binding MarR family transcriptional regulator